MATHNEPYDPYIPSGGAGGSSGHAGGAGAGGAGNNNRTAALQAVSLPSKDGLEFAFGSFR
jgi:hypothetical protein